MFGLAIIFGCIVGFALGLTGGGGGVFCSSAVGLSIGGGSARSGGDFSGGGG